MHAYNKEVDTAVMSHAAKITSTNLIFLNVKLQMTHDPDQVACVKEITENGGETMRLMTCKDWDELSRILKLCIEDPEGD